MFRVEAPAGEIRMEAVRGLVTPPASTSIRVGAGEQAAVELELSPLWSGVDDGWYSGDHHFHLNYGGTYRLRPESLVTLALNGQLPLRAHRSDLETWEASTPRRRAPPRGSFSPGSTSPTRGSPRATKARRFPPSRSDSRKPGESSKRRAGNLSPRARGGSAVDSSSKDGRSPLPWRRRGRNPEIRIEPDRSFSTASETRSEGFITARAPKEPTRDGSAATSCITENGIPIRWERRRSPHSSRTSRPRGTCLGVFGEGIVRTVTFSPDGAIVAAAGEGKVVRLYDAGSGTPLRDLAGHKEAIYSLAFSPDGKTVASASRDFMAIIWNVGTGEPVGRLERIGYVDSIAFSLDGRHLVTSDDLQVWDVATGAKTRRFGVDCYSIAFSPDGKQLACGWGKAVKLFDFTTGSEVLPRPVTPLAQRGRLPRWTHDRFRVLRLHGQAVGCSGGYRAPRVQASPSRLLDLVLPGRAPARCGRDVDLPLGYKHSRSGP